MNSVQSIEQQRLLSYNTLYNVDTVVPSEWYRLIPTFSHAWILAHLDKVTHELRPPGELSVSRGASEMPASCEGM